MRIVSGCCGPRGDARARAAPGSLITRSCRSRAGNLLLAAVLWLFGKTLGYGSLGVVRGAAAAWSREVAIDQALGLALHAGVVFVRGVLPAVLAAGSVCILWRQCGGAHSNEPPRVRGGRRQTRTVFSATSATAAADLR